MASAEHTARRAGAQDSESTSSVPAHTHRPKYLALKPEAARVLRVAMERDGLTQEQLAFAWGLQRAHIARMGLGHERHSPTILHLRCSPASARHTVRALLAFAAEPHSLSVVPAPVVLDQPEIVRSARVLRECTDLPRAMAENRADGELSIGELETELLEAEQAAETALEHAAHVRRELQRRRASRG